MYIYVSGERESGKFVGRMKESKRRRRRCLASEAKHDEPSPVLNKFNWKSGIWREENRRIRFGRLAICGTHKIWSVSGLVTWRDLSGSGKSLFRTVGTTFLSLVINSKCHMYLKEINLIFQMDLILFDFLCILVNMFKTWVDCTEYSH